MAKLFYVLVIFFAGIGADPSSLAEETPDLRESIAKEFAGVYHFNYFFIENGVPYVDVADHLQFLELDRFEHAPRVTFLNQTGKGEKRGHYNYVFHQKDRKLTLREFDGAGKFRFDCVGTFEPQKRTFECSAPRAPKPARDTDSPITRKSGLFKRPTTWLAYEVLDRHDLFRFYDWGFVNIQANVKLDADGKIVAREAGVMTAVKVKAQRAKPSRDHANHAPMKSDDAIRNAYVSVYPALFRFLRKTLGYAGEGADLRIVLEKSSSGFTGWSKKWRHRAMALV